MVPKFKLHDYVRMYEKPELGIGVIVQIDVNNDYEKNICDVTYVVEFEGASYSTIRLLGEQRRYERFPHVERALEHKLISQQEFEAMSKMNLEEPIQSMKVGYVSPVSANVDYRSQDVITASIDQKWHRNMIAQAMQQPKVKEETMTTPTNTPSILDTIKADAIDGLYRSAADQLTELGTSILIEVLKAEGTDDSVLHHLAEALKKPIGQAIARATAGYLIQAAPGLVPVPANIAPKLARLSKEFRTGAYAVGYNTVAEKVLPRLVPALTTLLAGLPEETV